MFPFQNVKFLLENDFPFMNIIDQSFSFSQGHLTGSHQWIEDLRSVCLFQATAF
jgi:hypothetical protein